jgi:CRISPR-associated exonuclease Cas4
MAGELEQPHGSARSRRAADDDVNASEVAAYAYCAKAWHLEYVLGLRADAIAEERRELGIAKHDAHGARVRRLQRVGQPLLRIALILFAVAGTLVIAALLVGRGWGPRIEMPVLGLREILFVGAAVALLAGMMALLFISLASRGSGFRPTLRAGASVVGSDTGAAPSVLLSDPVLGLRGRPDYLLEERDGTNPVLVPLEVKPSRRSQRLYESDAVQLGAYLIAARATFGSDAATFGYVRYAERSFRVALTTELERRVREIVAGIRRGRTLPRVHRTHRAPARCARCAVRGVCDDALR